MAEQCIFPITAACPHFSNCNETAYCGIFNEPVLKIDGVDMLLCTSRHYEVCYVYSNSLRKEIFGRLSLQNPKVKAVPTEL